jgi:hypothetical protein
MVAKRANPTKWLVELTRVRYFHGNCAGTRKPVISGRTIDQKSRTLPLTVSVSMPSTL